MINVLYLSLTNPLPFIYRFDILSRFSAQIKTYDRT